MAFNENVPFDVPFQVPTPGPTIHPGYAEKAKPANAAHTACKTIRKITCVGSGFVGGPTSAVTAFMTNIDVTVVDINAERIKAWNSNWLPIYEPGLNGIVYAARDGTSTNTALQYSDPQVIDGRGRKPNLRFSTDIDSAITEADMIFVCVNTPTKANGIGKGAAADLGFVEAATRNIAQVATQDKIIVEKSTVPCRTAQSIRDLLSANAKTGVRFDVLSNPEFLAEGTAVRDLLNPDRVIIGSETTPEGLRAANSLIEVYSQWIPRERIITMNSWSSELSKLAANALLAQRISSVNALSEICEATGADVNEVSHACGLDSRIGPHMLKAGPGFGGSCFQKDVFNIVYLSESLHLYKVADYWRGITKMNEHQKDRFTKRIISCLFNNLNGKKIAALGFAFKKDTSDTRESPAITLVHNFVVEKAQVAIYDPKVKEAQIWMELVENGGSLHHLKQNILVCNSAYEACIGADAIVIVTDWEQFSNKTPTKKRTHRVLPSRSGTLPPTSYSDQANLRSPQKKKKAGLVIKNPDTGEVVNFQKQLLSNSPKASGTHNSKDTQYYGENTLIDVTTRTRRPQLELKATNKPPPPVLTEIRQNISQSPSCANNRSISLDDENGLFPADVPSLSTPKHSSYTFIPEKPANEWPSKTIFGPEPEKPEPLDWARIAAGMRKPMWVFDGRNILDGDKLEALGFRVETIGKASKYSGFN